MLAEVAVTTILVVVVLQQLVAQVVEVLVQILAVAV
jgi:hypothetical protein